MMERGLSTREAVRVELARSSVNGSDTLDQACLQAARLSARLLKVGRVGIWFFEEGATRIRCRHLYEAASDRSTEGEVVDLAECPSYAAALHTFRTVSAPDALNDPRTRELAPYLRKHGIGALLDSPIFEEGLPVGIICHEHIGPARDWSRDEAHFAATVSDMLGLYLAQASAQRTYRSLLDARAELDRARVMESVGRLAAGVAHDFNNVLTALGLRSQQALLRAGSASAAEAASEIETLVEQGARLVRQLLAVTQQRQRSVAPGVDLGEVLQGMMPFLRTLEPDGVRLEISRATRPLPIPLDLSRAEQILTNLAVNARDAMLGGGVLRMEVGTSPASEPNSVGRVFLRVVDTGVGMNEHTRERIFEPYFTTKRAGQGVGLGLSTVYRIVKDSGGSIRVESTLGAGTEFLIEWMLR